jgi:hypothetical protein
MSDRETRRSTLRVFAQTTATRDNGPSVKTIDADSVE